MPELPEVEAARRLLHEAFTGHYLVDVDVRDDEIVFEGVAPEVLRAVLMGARVIGTGRQGKYFWMVLEGGPTLVLHLGMSGGLVETTPGRARAAHYYRVNHDAGAEEGPRFVKLALTGDDGRSLVFADGRRLGRVWLVDSANHCSRISRLGPDAWQELPELTQFAESMAKRRTPIKALLLNQAWLAGIGNYLADEVLYAAGIAPARLASSLSGEEAGSLRRAITQVIAHAVSVDADYRQFPPEWLFHVRWGGGKGEAFTTEGEPIVREAIGGRTTAWVPSRQK